MTLWEVNLNCCVLSWMSIAGKASDTDERIRWLGIPFNTSEHYNCWCLLLLWSLSDVFLVTPGAALWLWIREQFSMVSKVPTWVGPWAPCILRVLDMLGTVSKVPMWMGARAQCLLCCPTARRFPSDGEPEHCGVWAVPVHRGFPCDWVPEHMGLADSGPSVSLCSHWGDGEDWELEPKSVADQGADDTVVCRGYLQANASARSDSHDCTYGHIIIKQSKLVMMFSQFTL